MEEKKQEQEQEQEQERKRQEQERQEQEQIKSPVFIKNIFIDEIQTVSNVSKMWNINEFYLERKSTSTLFMEIEKLPTIINSIKDIPKKTNILCWYCDSKFDTIPIYIPKNLQFVDYNDLYLHVTGCFCSFNCAQAFIELSKQTLEQKLNKSSMLKILYKIYTGEEIVSIKPTIHKYNQHKYGGNINTAEFKKSFKRIKFLKQRN